MNVASDAGCLLEVHNLRRYFPVRGGPFSRTVGQVKAVDGVSFSLGRGETLGLVGESGSGKTTIGKLVLRLLEASGGTVLFEGTDILSLRKQHLHDFRRNIQMVFQDPHSSLNPRMSVEDILAEGLVIHRLAEGSFLRHRVRELLEMVKLSPHDMYKYPHEFSSGQRQRIGIARALSVNPKCLVADEPVSALDVSIQAQLLNLLLEIQRNYQVACLLITHDLSVVKYVSHRIAVLYLGRIVEMAETSALFSGPLHPYTRMLFSAVPRLSPAGIQTDHLLRGEVPSALNPPSGCAFHPRCRYRKAECQKMVPELKDAGDGHFVRCLMVT
jgi:oligopeptide/dipeptide ABC transporter ATP-binding protein